ncbi:MAG: 3-oxoacyl-ACP reductase FabG [Proteobacteria bacterium]|nr:3-oxoacyl-ACP reductase FabG [Pseudomonadota bacterium]
MTLENKAALVTGSSRGIGRAIALRFAADGARVAVSCVTTRDKAEAVAREIEDGGGEAIVVQGDVSLRADADRMIAETTAAFGAVDILVSNAGIVIDKPFLSSTPEDWAAAMENNLHGFFNVCQAALPGMIERGAGRIIATGSIITEVADFGGNCFSVCAASKGGIIAMMRPMAAEVARHGVTVNAVSPGYIATEMLDEIDELGREAALRLVPMKRYGRPEEIAAAMAFLASDDAAYITGQTLRVNGGMSMG